MDSKIDHKQSLWSKNRNWPELENFFGDHGKQKIEIRREKLILGGKFDFQVCTSQR